MFHVLLSLFLRLSCRSAFASSFAVFWQRFLGWLAVLPVSGLRGKRVQGIGLGLAVIA